MTKLEKQNRVDRWIDRAKNHPVLATIFSLGLIVFAVAKLADSEKVITEAWDRWHHVSPKVLVEPVVGWQPGVDIDKRLHFKSDNHPRSWLGPELDISWITLLAVTNLTDRPVAITEFDPAFKPVDTDQAMLAVRDPGVVDAFVTNNEDAFHEGTGNLEFRIGSIILPPGSKRYIAFRTDLVMAQHGQQIELANMDEAKRLVLLAIGGDADDRPCRVVVGPFGGLFRFADDTSFTFASRTALFVPGCHLTETAIQK